MSAELQGGESSTMVAVRLRRVNRWLAPDRGEELADLYVDSLGEQQAALEDEVFPAKG
ncbi:hypothetical protein [Streptomyces sp. TLI_185]|uniref:hypothetical protein n=1 Tax=Streptomyces sp. TLI_185 TaxID=2485151 RepID=UPI000FB2CCCD|nr:hypothetical protein [Streptomyces sp. TLI_185]RPF36434.1 hypothetical protein EDD92_6473 [Streptomyces sp. TLI_185]